MMELTKERLQEIAEDGFLKHGEAKEMARQLLAGLEQKPVAYYFPSGEREIEQVSLPDDLDDGQKANCIPLYAAPQLPQPAVVDEWRMMCGEWRDETVSIHDDSGLIVSGISPNAAGIIIDAHNAFRTAMLQGADGNPPVILDDVRRMDWLVSKTVDVREPMVYGSHRLFWSQTITDEEDDYHATKLREQIDAAMAAENAAAPQQEVK